MGKKLFTAISICAIYTLLFSPCAFAAAGSTESMEEMLFMEIPVVTSVGFFDMATNKSPVYSQVFSQDQIKTYSARSINELLDMYAVGVSTSYHFFGSLIGQRGISIDCNAKTAFLYGGVNLNQRFHFGYVTPLDIPLMGDIDRLEVINGPGAITQGSGAINGFINVIPKTGTTNPGITLTAEHGFVDELNKIEGSYGKIYDRGDLFFYCGVVGARGYPPKWDSSQLTTQNGYDDKWIHGYPDDYAAKRLEPNSYKFTLNWNHGKFNFLGYYADSYVTPLHDPQYYLNTMDDNSSVLPTNEWAGQSGTWRQQQLVLGPHYTLELSNTDAIEIQSHVQFVNSGRYDDRIDSYVRLWANDSTETEYFLKPVYKTTRFNKQNLAAGFSLSKRNFYDADPLFGESFDLTGESNLAYADDSVVSQGNFFNWLESSIFIEDQIFLTDALTLIAGGRYDAVKYAHKHLLGSMLLEDYYKEFSPRLAAAYEFKPGHIVKASYQKGFRHPDVNNQKTVNSTLAPVNSETMDSYEMGYSGDLNKRMKLAGNVFLNNFQDTIGWASSVDPEQPGFGNLTEDFSAIGGEVILKIDLPEDLQYNFGYAFARPYDFPESIQKSSVQKGIMEVNAGRDAFTRYPKHQLKSNITKKFLDGRLTTHLSYIYTTATNEMDPAGGALSHPNFKKDRHQLDISLIYKVRNNFDLQFIGKNLTGCPAGRPAWSASADATNPGIEVPTCYLIGKVRL
ncbi:MAG: TonB-dependent receptor [Candidatus Omnitrophica bacterium]|nr:TonB-dependent receptor [Candidatus Omnitrophota bacterium]